MEGEEKKEKEEKEASTERQAGENSQQSERLVWDADALYHQIGSWGRWQARVYLMYGFVYINLALYYIEFTFIVDVPAHHCKIPANQTKNETIPKILKDGEWQDDQCNMYVDYSQSNKTMPCTDGWEFDPNSGYISTIVTDFNLVCDRNLQVEISMMLSTAVRGASELSAAKLADMYGRKPVFLGGLLLRIVAGIAKAFSPNMIVYMALDAIAYLAMTALWSIMLVMCLELFPTEYRSKANTSFEFFWFFGLMLSSLLAYLIRDWRMLELAMYCPLLMGVSYFWLLDETIPWLVTRGRYQEAEKILRRAACINGTQLQDDFFSTTSYGACIPRIDTPKDNLNGNTKTITDHQGSEVSMNGTDVLMNDCYDKSRGDIEQGGDYSQRQEVCINGTDLPTHECNDGLNMIIIKGGKDSHSEEVCGTETDVPAHNYQDKSKSAVEHGGKHSQRRDTFIVWTNTSTNSHHHESNVAPNHGDTASQKEETCINGADTALTHTYKNGSKPVTHYRVKDSRDTTEEVQTLINKSDKSQCSPLRNSKELRQTGLNSPQVAPEKRQEEDRGNKDKKVIPSVMDVLKSKKMLIYTTILILIWCTDSIVYTALNITVTYLSGDRYLNFFLLNLAELPGLLSFHWTLNKFGRRYPVCVYHIIGGFALLFTVVESSGIHIIWLQILLNFIGKFALTASYSSLQLCTPELFPTSVRGTFIGICFFIAVVAQLLAPLCRVMERTVPGVFRGCGGCLCIVAGLLALLLPETFRRPLPETVEEVESWSRSLSAGEIKRYEEFTLGEEKAGRDCGNSCSAGACWKSARTVSSTD